MTILPDSSTCQINPRNVEKSTILSMTNTSSTQATAAAAAALAASTPTSSGRRPRTVNFTFGGPVPSQNLIHKLSSESCSSSKTTKALRDFHKKQDMQKGAVQGKGELNDKWGNDVISSPLNDEDITLDDLLKDDPISEYIDSMETPASNHNQTTDISKMRQNYHGDMSSKIDDVFRGSTQMFPNNSLQVPQTVSMASDSVYSNTNFNSSNATLVDKKAVPSPLHLRGNSFDMSDQVVPPSFPKSDAFDTELNAQPQIYMNDERSPEQYAVPPAGSSNVNLQDGNSLTAFSTSNVSQLDGFANPLQVDESVLPSPGDSATLSKNGVFHRSFSSSTSASNTSLSSASFIHGSGFFQGPSMFSPNSSAVGLELSPSSSLIGMNSASPIHQLRHVSSVEKFRNPRKKGTLRRRIRSRHPSGREQRKVLSEKQMATAAAAAATTSNHQNIPRRSNAPAMITAAAANATKRYRAVQKLKNTQKQNNRSISFMYVKPTTSGMSDGQNHSSGQDVFSTPRKETPKNCGMGQDVIMYTPKKFVNHQICRLNTVSPKEPSNSSAGRSEKDSDKSTSSSNSTVKLHSPDTRKKTRVPFTDKNPDFASLIGKFPKKDEQPFKPKTYNNINQGLLEFQVNLGDPHSQH